ncbi:hypothetical protein chiPu_0023337 [Chiloscyllium punctatum]|uniref:Uncharacterized protein n=1 Tax=Chiloscyllium punctatum TaxID=137246 RepID=A0A401T8N2_CHIPU|nr:hypothetical protein [Chiloscyllium punctatum]
MPPFGGGADPSNAPPIGRDGSLAFRPVRTAGQSERGIPPRPAPPAAIFIGGNAGGAKRATERGNGSSNPRMVMAAADGPALYLWDVGPTV